ncbi:electron transfer flavoprotein subunit alpha/FixB family protein [Truepera radiovictrix]|uniref:Electron transfer flavoprotein alpha subunit n=1 Tax=Truepera radiovictrix (strain DSM 17093 / CIP 108686 / LMG 22925 / RQ-24) TaxID=649638 RepID=D7CXW0_TRURR|nr:electron transfer flavoprotein subunit alpha/FixB family protein [Truepera radiovictrix]ADI13320.1 Electron transfer flavoprotein alpha subunit [Truepera radiovictrix DSM 17093]WMT58115.1 electron transfer flavoprotein subunit alpha/FixB family protein [Truepera radiovictrix]
MILILAEHDGARLRKSAYELVSAARATGREGPVTMLVLGSGVAAVADEAAALAEQVLVADLPELTAYDPELWAAAAAQIATEGEAHTVLVAGSRSGREYSPRLAVKLAAPLLEDVIALVGEGDALRAQRGVFLARVTETLQTDAPVVVVSVKPGSFAPAQPADARGEQYDVELSLPERRVRASDRRSDKTGRVPLTEAEVVVTGGRGLGSAERFAELVEGLADTLGAGVGATRAVVDAGWRPYAEQIGQTGKTVQPNVYVALGTSGAVQHLSGMNKSRYVVAVNKDPDAPIFKVTDFGVVGDVTEVVPALIRALKAG